MSKIHTLITRHQVDKQSKATSSPFPIEMIAKLYWTQSNAQQKYRTITESPNGSNNQHQTNNNRNTALERTAAKATDGLKCILLVPKVKVTYTKKFLYDPWSKIDERVCVTRRISS